MSISPYLKPGAINSVLTSTSKIGGYIYPDGLDKRQGFLSGGTTIAGSSLSSYVDTTKDLIDTTANALSSRSPMYIIGEIYDGYSIGDKLSKWLPSTENLVRAVNKTVNGVKQTGVIIDGLGDMDGTMSVEFTANPTYFMASTTTDQRYRKPTTLRMTVMVSNYLSDNILGGTLSGLSSLDPTGLFGNLESNILYGGNTRAQNALYNLRWLMENGEPFTVYTPHGIYENMLIKSLKPTTDAEKMDMLYCDVEFQEIIFFTPYTNQPGVVPARKGIVKPSSWAGIGG